MPNVAFCSRHPIHHPIVSDSIALIKIEEMVNFCRGKIAEQKIQDAHPFPKVAFPAYDSQREGIAGVLESITTVEKEWIERELRDSGAVLFRGFGIKTAADFNAFVEALGWEEQPYKGPALRRNFVGRVWSANEGPLDQHIFFHHEMALTKESPGKVLFFCEIPPPEGGETAIVKSDRVADHMESKFPKLVEQLDKKGILTCTLLPKEDNLAYFLGRSWQSQLQTRDPQEARGKVEEGGGRLEWMKDGSANITAGPTPATRMFENRKRKMWFNYIPGAVYGEGGRYNRLVCGDGSPIPACILKESERVMESECVDIKWEAGDVLLIDNLAVLHARRPSLPPRRILVALCK